MCVKIIPASMWDYAAGLDQEQGKPRIKTEDGRWWTLTTMSAMEAACAGITIGYQRGDEICDH
jgi:hypothetical protein